MNNLNYNHLFYFWNIVRFDGVTKAAQQLRVSQPALTSQIRLLESQLSEKLFEKKGRRLILSDAGKLVYRYADEIFNLASEMGQVLQGGVNPLRPARLVIGIVDAVPKLVAYEMLKPLINLDNTFLTCREDSRLNLLTALVKHEVDAIISDSPINASEGIKAYNHQVGESPLAVFGVTALVKKCKRNFPHSLGQVPILLPTSQSQVRKDFDLYCARHKIIPMIKADYDDSALLKVFASHGHGLFLAPYVIRDEVKRVYQVDMLARLSELNEKFYVITSERKIKNPALTLLQVTAIHELMN